MNPKKIFVLILLSLILLTGCNSSGSRDEQENSKEQLNSSSQNQVMSRKDAEEEGLLAESDKQETDDSTSADNMSDKTENTNNISDTADSDKEESSSSVSGNSVSGNTASAEITPSSNAADNTAISSSVQAGGSSYHSDEVIPQRQYYRQKNLKDFQIDNSIKSIGRLAFAESGLESIDIPESVKEIEYGAFMNCASLEDITIPDTVERIGTKAFAGTQWMKNWMELTGGSSKNDFLIVGDGILLAYRGTEITHISIPDGVKQIGSEAFKDHTEIMWISLNR